MTPIAHEDHALRACYAALRMQEAVNGYAGEARRAHGVTVQIRVAEQLGISRGALAQFESGRKAPNSLQLVRLAEIYRRELGELLAEEFDEAGRDPLTALFWADLQLASAVAECAKLCREYTNLETLLGIDQDRVYDVTYNTPPCAPAGTPSARANGWLSWSGLA